MTQSQFIGSLKREVASLATSKKIPKSRAFLVWFAKVAFEMTDAEALEATAIDGANDKGIDLFYIDHEDGKVIICQGKYSEACTHRARIADVSQLQQSLNWLASPEALRRDGKKDLATNAEEYLAATRDGYGVELWFVYAGPRCANVEKSIAVYNQNTENEEVRRATRHCDLSLLQMYFEESTGHSTRLNSGTIELLDDKHFGYQADFGQALVATISATELVRLYRTYGDRLFERNVRLFLGAKKGSVNAVIAETLRGPAKSNFWAYNNGLTFVCDSFVNIGNAVKMTNFCIVNGCQSTRSLFDQEPYINESVTALIRVLAVGNNIVDDVIRFTNSQNPIRAWDLASQHKTQRKLKRDFDNLDKPYIYITRRGDRIPEDVSKYKNGGRPRQIKLAEVGQYLAALVGKPVMAYKNKAFIYSIYHDDVFPQDIKVEEVLFASICSEATKAVVEERLKESDGEDTRILTKGGPIFTMAVLGHIARLRNGATFLKTLGEGQITSNLARERFTKYAEYAVVAYLRSMKDQLELSSEDLGTAIRQPEFFDKVRDRVGTQYAKDRLAGEDWLKSALPKIV